jgi:hypothetical protein
MGMGRQGLSQMDCGENTPTGVSVKGNKMKTRFITTLSLVLLTLFVAVQSPARATQADDATYDITSSGPANPKIVQVSTDQETHTSSVSFSVSLTNKDDTKQEEPVKGVKSQSYSVSAGDGGIITSITAFGGINATPNAATYSWTVTGGATGSISVTVKYTTYGHKKVSVSGTVTFDDDSTLNDSADADVTAVEVRILISTNMGLVPVPPDVSLSAGERVYLRGDVRPGDLSLSGHRWDIQGRRLSDFAASVESGKVWPSLESPNTQTVTFCWVEAGSYTSNYYVTIEGIEFDAAANFGVKKPSSTIEVEHVGNTSIDDNWIIGAGTSLHFGSIGDPGLRLKANDQSNGCSPGDYHWIQLADAIFHRQTANSQWWRYEGHGLDGSLPYPAVPTPDRTEDYPGISSNGTGGEAISIETSLQANTWRMYFSYGSPFTTGMGIPVPLAKRNWSWSAKVRRPDINAAWPAQVEVSVNQGTSTATNQYPEWSSNVQATSSNPVPGY